MRDFGSVNDPAAGTLNTNALLAALAARGNGEPLEIFFAAGDWHFSGPLPVNTHSDLSIFDNVTLSGVFTGPSVQHQEQGPPGANAMRDRTRLIITMTNESDTWWKHVRLSPSYYRFGPLAFRDITFQLSATSKGSLFAFGDPANTDAAKVTLRGLTFERCYLTRQLQYGSSNVGDGRAWLIDAAGGRGWVLNLTNQSYGLRLHNCYDVTLDLYIRGFKYGVINQQGDRVRGHLRGFILGKLLDEYAIAVATAPVGAHWQTLYAEAVALAGAVVNGQVDQFRGEWGVYAPSRPAPDRHLQPGNRPEGPAKRHPLGYRDAGSRPDRVYVPS
jgi:hypothetical protein